MLLLQGVAEILLDARQPCNAEDTPGVQAAFPTQGAVAALLPTRPNAVLVFYDSLDAAVCTSPHSAHPVCIRIIYYVQILNDPLLRVLARL